MTPDRKSTRLNSSHTEIYTLSLHDALPISHTVRSKVIKRDPLSWHGSSPTWARRGRALRPQDDPRSEEHTSELQSHRDLHSFPTRRSSDLAHREEQGYQAGSPFLARVFAYLGKKGPSPSAPR